MTRLEGLQDLLARTDDPKALLPISLAAGIVVQRREAKRRLAIVAEYRELLDHEPHKRNVNRVAKAERIIRKRHGIGARSVQRYAANLVALRGPLRKILLGDEDICFADLPAAVRRTAMARLAIVREWTLLAQATLDAGEMVHETLQIFCIRHPNVARSSLYRWARMCRRFGFAGLLDRRQLRFLSPPTGRAGGG